MRGGADERLAAWHAVGDHVQEAADQGSEQTGGGESSAKGIWAGRDVKGVRLEPQPPSGGTISCQVF